MHNSAGPAADTVPLASPPDATDAGMPQATPASSPQDFLDGAMVCANKLWAEDSEPSTALETARQAVQHVHAKHS